MEKEKTKTVKMKWDPVLSQKPQTRSHGNVNNIEKVVAYKRKQNWEVPRTYKGKSFPTLDPHVLVDQTSKINLKIGTSTCSRIDIVNDLVANEKERCLAFANKNPETVLLDNLDVELVENIITPARSILSNPVGTADVLGKSPAVLTKVKPCGLSHPLKIA